MDRFFCLLIISFFILSCASPTVLSIGGGGTNFNCDHFFNPSPAQYEEDVEIGIKGVQTCINVTVDQNCTVNITFQWMNWSRYMYDWANWEEGDEWPDYYNDSYWTNYSDWTGLNVSQRICAYQENVSCRTEGDWATMWSDWRIIANFTCAGNYTYNETCYYFFTPELCPVNYIHPPSPNGTICPCCDAMCVGVHNTLGHSMNITIYRNDTQFEDFYIINQFINVTNGTYCFCIDGHINNSLYYPMLYNTTYHWYVNVTDTTTNESTESSIFQFNTYEHIESCPCGLLDLDEYFCPPLETGLSMGIMGGLLGGILGSFLLIQKKKKRGGES